MQDISIQLNHNVTMLGDGDCSLVSFIVSLISAYLNEALDDAIGNGEFDDLLYTLNRYYLVQASSEELLPMESLEQKKDIFLTFLLLYSNFEIENPYISHAINNGGLDYLLSKLGYSMLLENTDPHYSKISILTKALSNRSHEIHNPKDPLFPPISILIGIFRQELVDTIRNPRALHKEFIENHFNKQGIIPTQRLPASFRKYQEKRIQGCSHKDTLNILRSGEEEDTFFYIQALTDFFEKLTKDNVLQENYDFNEYWEQEGRKHYLNAIGTPQHWLSAFPEIQVLSKKYGLNLICIMPDGNILKDENLQNPTIVLKFKGNHYEAVPHKEGYERFLMLRPFILDQQKKPWLFKKPLVNMVPSIKKRPNENKTPRWQRRDILVEIEKDARELISEIPEKNVQLKEKARELLEEQKKVIEDVLYHARLLNKKHVIVYWISVSCLILFTMILCVETLFILPTLSWFIFLLIPGGGFGMLQLIGAIALFFHLKNRETLQENEEDILQNTPQESEFDALKIAIYWIIAVSAIILSIILCIELFFLFPVYFPLLIGIISLSCLEVIGITLSFIYLLKAKHFFDKQPANSVLNEKTIKENCLIDQVHSNNFEIEGNIHDFEIMIFKEAFKYPYPFSKQLASYLLQLRLGRKEEIKIVINKLRGEKETSKMIARLPEYEWVHRLINAFISNLTLKYIAFFENSNESNKEFIQQEKLIIHLSDMINYTVEYDIELENKFIIREIVLSYVFAIWKNHFEMLPYIFQVLRSSVKEQIIYYLLDEREFKIWFHALGLKSNFYQVRSHCLHLLSTSSNIYEKPLFIKIAKKLMWMPEVFSPQILYNITFNVLKSCHTLNDEYNILLEILSNQIVSSKKIFLTPDFWKNTNFRKLPKTEKFQEHYEIDIVLYAYEDYCASYYNETYSLFSFLTWLESILDPETQDVFNACMKTFLGKCFTAARNPNEFLISEVVVQGMIRLYKKSVPLFENFLTELLNIPIVEINEEQNAHFVLFEKLLLNIEPAQFLEIQYLLLDKSIPFLKFAPSKLFEKRMILLIETWLNDSPTKIATLYKKYSDSLKENCEALFMKLRTAYEKSLFPFIENAQIREQLLNAQSNLQHPSTPLILQGALEAIKEEDFALNAVTLLLNNYKNEGHILLLSDENFSDLNGYVVDYYRLFILFATFIKHAHVEFLSEHRSSILFLITEYLRDYYKVMGELEEPDNKNFNAEEQLSLRNQIMNEMTTGSIDENNTFWYFFERAIYEVGGIALQTQGLNFNFLNFKKKIQDPCIESDHFVLAAKECLVHCESSEFFLFWMIFLNVWHDRVKSGHLAFDVIIKIQEVAKSSCSPLLKDKIFQILQEAWNSWNLDLKERKSLRMLEVNALDDVRSIFDPLLEGEKLQLMMEYWENFFCIDGRKLIEFESLCQLVQLVNPFMNQEKDTDSLLFQWFGYFLYELNSDKVTVEQELTIHFFMKEYSKKYWPHYLQEALNFCLKMPRKSGRMAVNSFEFLIRTYAYESTYFHFRARSLFSNEKGELDLQAAAEEIKTLIKLPNSLFFPSSLSTSKLEQLESFLNMIFEWIRDSETGGKTENQMSQSGWDTMKMLFQKVYDQVGRKKGYALDILENWLPQNAEIDFSNKLRKNLIIPHDYQFLHTIS